LYHVNSDFDTGMFQKALKTDFLGREFIYRTSVGSTMNEANKEVENGAASGTIVLAEEQTQGRGRANRAWSSPAKTNLYFTIVFRPKAFVELPKLNFAAAIAIARTARTLGVQGAGVKWPNDVLVNHKKLAGILTDSWIMGQEILALVGIGLNVNQDMAQVADSEVRNVATSLAGCLGQPVCRELVLATLCNELEELLTLDMEDILESYREVDLLVGQKLWVMPKKRENPERRPAEALELNHEGSLVVRYEDTGEVAGLIGEEVSVRLQDHAAAQ
jgi:BirA family biotin operon repressor/biotin-[acetyl-CoA-carboxylase] ligase